MDNISIHAPCEGSDVSRCRLSGNRCISIHAPCEGSDDTKIITKAPTSISIHAPCEGSDYNRIAVMVDAVNFNPRSL